MGLRASARSLARLPFSTGVLPMSDTTCTIRPATEADLPAVVTAYAEHFAHERTHTACTVFREGVYPTERDARAALQEGALHVALLGDTLAGSIICNEREPGEYASVPWPARERRPEARALVLHLLMVRPCMAGRGVGTALVRYACELARGRGLDVVRLDTGMQNLPARHLYQKLGFTVICGGCMKIGGVLEHKDHLFLERELSDLS